MRGDLINPRVLYVIDAPLNGSIWFADKRTGTSKERCRKRTATHRDVYEIRPFLPTPLRHDARRGDPISRNYRTNCVRRGTRLRRSLARGVALQSAVLDHAGTIARSRGP